MTALYVNIPVCLYFVKNTCQRLLMKISMVHCVAFIC